MANGTYSTTFSSRGSLLARYDKTWIVAMQIIESAMAAKSDSCKEVSFHVAHYITNAFLQLVSRMKFALAFPDKAI